MNTHDRFQRTELRRRLLSYTLRRQIRNEHTVKKRYSLQRVVEEKEPYQRTDPKQRKRERTETDSVESRDYEKIVKTEEEERETPLYLL